jgi:transcriptional regulator GlxA family with amidase domain
VPPYRDGGQAQYIERPLPPASETGTGPTRDWALQRLALPLSLDELAAHAAMSTRTFARRFQEETGLSPGRWLTQQRLRRARHLLESSDLPVTGRPRGRLRHRHLAAAAPGGGGGGRPVGVPAHFPCLSPVRR